MGKHCTVDGCKAPEHAAGLCRTHYGRKWRGKPMEGRRELKRSSLEIADDRRLTMERELAEARTVYKMAVGIEARTKWGGKIRELEGFLQRGTRDENHFGNRAVCISGGMREHQTQA